MNPLEKILKNLHTLRLTSEARERMRDELIAYADLHAISNPTTAAVTAQRATSNYTLGFRLYAGLAAVLVLILGMGGTAYASEQALPGDILYSVKVGVAEPIQTALIPTETGKAAWHAILAERRLEEAAQLAARGDLDPTVQDTLATNFTTEVDASLHSAQAIEQEGDAQAALSARSDLEARVAAHRHILAVLAAHYETASTTDAVLTANSLHSLIAVVTEHQNTLLASRLQLEDTLSPDDTSASASATTLAMSTEDTGTAPSSARGKQAKLARRALIVSAASARIAETSNAREQEVSAILSRHAAMLAKFMPTATSTATTTATTTSEVTPSNDDAEEDTSSEASGKGSTDTIEGL